MLSAEKRVEKILLGELGLSLSALQEMASAFLKEMEKGLAGKDASLPMLPAYVGKPDGTETGTFAALDFGGTHVRVLLAELCGGGYEILKKTSFPLRGAAAGYDYTRATATGGALFSFIAGEIKRFIGGTQHYPLGFTFSFTCEHRGLNQAILLNWSKEIETSGVEGRDVGELLREALRHAKIENISLAAIVNDTIATLLTGAYRERNCNIAGILGTGYNVCYAEPHNPWRDTPMIINIEAGAFDQAPCSKYDFMLDESSERPGKHLLEKMISGKYLGELARLVLLDLHRRDLIFRCENLSGFSKRGAWDSADLSRVLENPAPGNFLAQLKPGEKWGLLNLKEDDYAALHLISRAVRDRSARLAAAVYAGVLRRIDPRLEQRHIIAVDGSLYEKMPGYAAVMEEALAELLGEKKEKISLRLTKDGSGIGAAIAAGMSQ
ncbi:MAG: hexokinase [Clostridia bacterium]|jgi:hexokinase|nr:hexokinase [Clostridia bacterium]